MRFAGKALIPLAALLASLISMPASAASKTFQTEVINNIRVGQVAIQIDEFELNKSGKEDPYRDNKIVVPGQTVSKIVRITNLGNDAWIRIKADFDADDPRMALSYADLILASDKWKKCGDYYYYTEPVYTGKYVDFIKEVKIPATWNESTSEKSTRIHFTSDAVQIKNFDPDFSSTDPWFGTLIEQRVYEPFTMKEEGTQAFSVEFENGADGFVRVGDDFFNNWPTLLPGDTVTGKVQIGNNYSKAVEIFFHTETIADDELLKQCTLKIMNGNTVIYDGPLSGTVDEIKLGKYNKGDKSELTYTLYIPKELTNKYALSSTKTKWVWTAKLQDNYTSGGGGGGGSSSGGGGHSSTPSRDPEGSVIIPPEEVRGADRDVPQPPPGDVQGASRAKTGDNNLILYGAIAIFISITGIIILIVTDRKRGR